jgi:hypothetical protein
MIKEQSLSKEGLIELIDIKSQDFSVYAVVDTAKNETLFTCLKGKKDELYSLFVKDREKKLKSVSPYLVPLEDTDSFWVIEEVVDKQTGYIMFSNKEPQQIVSQLSDWIYQKDEAGKVAIFRHYDPLVLKELIECEKAQNESIVSDIYSNCEIVLKATESTYCKYQIGSNL